MTAAPRSIRLLFLAASTIVGFCPTSSADPVSFTVSPTTMTTSPFFFNFNAGEN